ncbi:uncharacterized protein LOC141673222 [Apium graveolens]|uniref:uncharacterized protein LOC141673222 n=1 Tax=Apium graveolens TaxID=4045 RepID=UPI003D7AAA3C
MVDSTAGHELLTFLDASSGFNQIRMEPSECEKTAFITDRGIYCYLAMPFGLRNAGATFQRLVKRMFKDQIGKSCSDLQEVFDILRSYNMKLNPSKCNFAVSLGKFLGHLVTRRGIEASPEQIKAIFKLKSPSNVKDVQKLTGRVAALNRFISRLSDRCKLFYDVLRKNKGFLWSDKHEAALNDLKSYLTTPPLLSKLIQGEDLFIYLSVTDHAVSGVLVKESEGVQSLVYYVSKSLVDAEIRYTSLEKLVLASTMTSTKLRNYFESHKKHVMTNFPLRNILSKPDLTGRMEKWAIHLSTYDIMYDARTTIKSQALDDFVADFSPIQMTTAKQEFQQALSRVDTKPWTLYRDGASNLNETGLGLVLKSPQGDMIAQLICCDFKATNNEAEYEALIMGLTIAKDMKIKTVYVNCDSLLIVNHVKGSYEAKDPKMVAYLNIAKRLKNHFDNFSIQQIPRENNVQADTLARLGAVSKGLDLNNIPVVHIMKLAMKRLVLESEIMALDQRDDNISGDATTGLRHTKTICSLEMDIVGKMPSTPGQKVFMLAMTDYFSKWIEAEAFKQVTSKKSDRTTPKTSTGQTPYCLVYETEAVLPTDVMIPIARYGLLMNDMNNTELSHDKDTVDELREMAKIRLVSYQQRVSYTYNKHVHIRTFRVGDMVLRKMFQNTMDVTAGKSLTLGNALTLSMSSLEMGLTGCRAWMGHKCRETGILCI